MGWGAKPNLNRMTYDSCYAALLTARKKDDGKPMGSIRIFDRGSHYAVKYFSTDIVRYYPDGSIEITTGWLQSCTLSAIGQLTGKWVQHKNLPLFNSRKPYPEQAHCVDGFVFNSMTGYLRFGPDGKLDMSTVKPIEIDIITDIPAIRRAQKKAKTLCDQLLVRSKFSVTGGRQSLNFAWIERNLDVPLDEVDYDLYPSEDPHKIYKGAGHWLAKKIGASKRIPFKEFV